MTDHSKTSSELTVARARLGNAVGALIDAGTYCAGPDDVVAGIARVAWSRDVWKTVAIALHTELSELGVLDTNGDLAAAYHAARNGRETAAMWHATRSLAIAGYTTPDPATGRSPAPAGMDFHKMVAATAAVAAFAPDRPAASFRAAIGELQVALAELDQIAGRS